MLVSAHTVRCRNAEKVPKALVTNGRTFCLSVRVLDATCAAFFIEKITAYVAGAERSHLWCKYVARTSRLGMSGRVYRAFCTWQVSCPYRQRTYNASSREVMQ